MDETRLSAYLSRMAARLLLTLLALLTGLAAQLGPAQAESMGVSEVRIEVGKGDVRLAARPAGPALSMAPVVGRAPPCTILMLKRTEACAPAVMLGVDRARE